MEAGKLGGYDVVLLDTAGRTTLDDEMMAEAADIKAVANPHEVLLVLEATTGQNGLEQARKFTETSAVSGIILTKLDGTAKLELIVPEPLKVPAVPFVTTTSDASKPVTASLNVNV